MTTDTDCGGGGGKGGATLPLARLLPAIGGIYVTQTLITALAMQSVPALLRNAGASLQFVGLSTLCMLPWALKFLWAPAVERWRLPTHTTRRQSRPLILAGQSLLAASLLALAALGAAQADPQRLLLGQGPWLVLALLTTICLAATIDIACDGFAIDQLQRQQRAWGNVVQVGGSYVGAMLGGGGFLLLAGWHGWPAALAAAGVTVLLLTLPLYRIHEPPRHVACPPAGQPAADAPHTPVTPDAPFRPNLRHALARPAVRHGILLTLGLGIGMRIGAAMLGPLLLDRGASVTQLGWLFGGFSIAAGLAGTALGGLLVRRAGGWRAVWLAVALQASLLAALAGAAYADAPLAGLIVLAGLKFAAMGCGWVALYSALMGLASPRQAGVDFTLFQCADALVMIAGGIAGGWLAQRWGYATCFALAATLAGAAAWTVRRIDRCPPAGRPLPHPRQGRAS